MHGRFTSPDPLITSARSAVPQSWNRYAYVLNKPLSLIDPTGLMDCTPQTPCVEVPESEWLTVGPVVDAGVVTITPPSTALEILTTSNDVTSEITPRQTERVDDCLRCGEFSQEMHRRAVPAAQVLEVGAVIAVAEIAAPILLLEAAGAGVTTLGIEAASVDTAVIGSAANTAPYVGQAGFSVLRVGQGYNWAAQNVPWLDSVIRVGQPVLVLGGNRFTQREAAYLQRVGQYIWNSDFTKLIPK